MKTRTIIAIIMTLSFLLIAWLPCQADDVLCGCAKIKKGTLRLIDCNSQCLKSEYPVTLSGTSSQNPEPCPNILGDWIGNFGIVIYTSEHNFEQIHATLHISEQQGCLFFGNVEVDEMPEIDCVLTGSIVGNNIAMTMCGAIMRGTLVENNRMELTVEDIELFDGDMQSAGVGTVTRK